MMFTSYDSYLFHNGTDYELYRSLGAHVCIENGVSGTRFAVWAPHALSVSVITDATGWDEAAGAMSITEPEIWETFLPGVGDGAVYRYVITSADGRKLYKSDPLAFRSELRPANASVVCADSQYVWGDGEYIGSADRSRVLSSPMAIYEVHLGSWKKDYRLNEDGFLNYRTLADQLAEYVVYMGYTHVELIGICEYPFDGSWGYQVTGFFSPTSRYGSPDDFRYLVDRMHRSGIGVILDWVPAHFPKDNFGLSEFDGAPLYESGDPLRAEYPEWGTKAFDHGRPEVRSFLISSAFYWLREFHADALRVDAVAAMFFNSFGRAQWRPNSGGGPENLESTAFLRQLNKAVRDYTNGYLIAEDSSIVSGVTEDVDDGGVGFLLKWNLGWMNDTLKYMEKNPVYRKWHHDKLTHISDYAFTENFVLVLSHDEVVHLKHSMLEKFPGGTEDKMGGLKSLYAYQFSLPGKKLIFMGQDIAEDREWDENREINWGFSSDFGHRDVMHCVKNLLSVYRAYSVLHADSRDSRTFEWIKRDDAERNIVSFIRRNPWTYDSAILVICNFSPVAYPEYSCGTPVEGMYKRIFSTYDSLPGGGSPGELGDIPPILTRAEECDGHHNALHYGLRAFESVMFEFPIK